MGILDIFRRKKEIVNTTLKVEKIVSDDTINQDEKKDIISDERIEKIKNKYNMYSLSNILLDKLNKYPELIDILLNENISNTIIYLMEEEIVNYLSINKNEYKYSKYINFSDEIKQLLSLLNNQVQNIDEDKYISCYIDITKDIDTIEYINKINSYIPNIELELDKQVLTKLDSYCSYKLYLPKDKYNIVSHDFHSYIEGNINFNEDIIIEMPEYIFKYLDTSIINKISKCMIKISDNDYTLERNDTNNNNYDYNYKLIKYNHLIYIFENSTLEPSIKDKLIYNIKNLYYDSFYDLGIEELINPYIDIIGYDELNRLTKQFIDNISIYINKEIDKPKLNIKYYIDDKLSDIENMSKEDIISFISYQNDDIKEYLFEDERILNKLGLDNTNKEKIKEIIFLFNENLTNTTTEFINSLEFDVEKFMTSPENNFKSLYGINYLQAKFGVRDYIEEIREISIADLIGTSYNPCEHDKNILHTFNSFFENNGDGYHTRALSLLEYKNGTELLKALNDRNNDTKDMNVLELEDGNYVISSNGLHRFTILRFHYLLDKMKGEKSEEELRKLYTIPVNVEGKINCKKTYCNYLISLLNNEISYISFNSETNIIKLMKKDNTSVDIDEEQLLSLAQQCCEYINNYDLYEITKYYNSIESFKNFVDEYIPNLSLTINNSEQKRVITC